MKTTAVCTAVLAVLIFSLADGNAQNRKSQAGDVSAGIRLDVGGIPPLAPSTGRVEAYTVTSVEQLVPGQLADTYFGDYVLKNNAMRVTVSHPDKKQVGGIGGGHVIDVLSSAQHYDYMNHMQLVPDVESTASRVVYSHADEPRVIDNTTATVVLHGKADIFSLEQPELDPLSLDVVTSYSLPADSNVLHVTTRFINTTSSPVHLQPGDLIDWGQAATFVEGVGLTGNGTVHRSNFTLGFADDFSLGYVTSGTEKLEGLYTIRDALITPVTSAAPDGRVVSRVRAEENRKRAPEAPDRGGFGQSGSSNPLNAVIQKSAVTALSSPLQETTYGTETSYAAAGRTEATTATTSITSRGRSNGESTSTIAAIDEAAPASARITRLEPGESLIYKRYLVLSDRDFSRIADFAYAEKKVATGIVAGAVLESGSERPIAGADIFISGGPRWDGKITPNAFYRATSRENGTFAAPLPPGKYMISAAKVGRSSATPRTILDVTTGTQPQIVALSLTRESIVSIAVSQAETRTSTPLPCKVTFLPKQGTIAPDWGMGARGDRGVRNVYYLPYGAARIPVSPGNYLVLISRGIEYDVVRQDLRVSPGTNPVITASLPHSLKGKIPGLFSLDPGLMTTASAVSNASPEDRVIQAACEGVHLITSGDYGEATDLQQIIERMGLEKWVKAYPGMRLLFNKNEQSAELLAFPVTQDQATSMTRFANDLKDLPPDVAVSDLRRGFPEILLTITAPTDPLKGYLTPFEFNDRTRRFEEGQLPPPDFDAINIIEGKKLGVETLNYPRYMDMQISRTWSGAGKAMPLSPIGGSASRVTYGEEVGYPRIYLRTEKDTFSEVTADDLTQAIKAQKFLVTNGPIVLPKVQKLPGGEFVHEPGDVVDLSTTDILRMKIEVFAAPWITLSGIAVREYGYPQAAISEIRPHQEVRRYPVQDPGETLTRYYSKDAILDVTAYSSRRSLAPIVPDASPDFGGAVYPVAWTAPFFVDKNGDGRIELQHDQSMIPPATATSAGETSPSSERTK